MILGEADILLLEELLIPTIFTNSKVSFWNYFHIFDPVAREILSRIMLQ